MPQRDGTPTAEEEIAAQRAGHGVTPPPPGEGLPPAAAAAAALAATAAAAHSANTAPAALQPSLTVPAITAAAAGILGAFDRFLFGRRADQEDYVTELLEAEIPDLPEDARLDVVDTELEAERAFAAKARARLDRDLPKALSIADRALREAEVQKILDRERHYLELREAAVAVRALGAAETRVVKAKSPEGAYWHLSPYVRQHTLDCLAMGGKVWPWSVLEAYHPPLHGGCDCQLKAIDDAVREGLVGPDGFQTGDQAIYAMSIAEAAVDEHELDEEMALLEAAWERHWGKGTTKAGQFRPKRGGDPGAVLRRRRGHRMRAPHMATPEPVQAVASLSDALDVRDLKVADLREGDRVMVNGELERVEQVHPNSPGLLTLARSGLVHIDRDTIRGVPKDTPEWTKESREAARREWSEEAPPVSTGYVDRLYDGKVPKDVATALRNYKTARLAAGNASPDDFEAKLAAASVLLRDLQGKLARPQPTAEDVRQIRAIIRSDNEFDAIDALTPDQRGRLLATGLLGYTETDPLGKPANVYWVSNEGRHAAREPLPESAPDDPPPPQATGGPDHAAVLKAARMRKPADGGELMPGVHFDAGLSRSETRDGELFVPPGFFKQSRAIREKVLFRHLGGRLADGLGADGIRALGEQDDTLKSRRAIIDAFYTLNSEGRDRFIDLRPDAARLVATAAVERDVPLHPDAAKLARRPATIDTPAPEHPAHSLAKRVEALTGTEARDMLVAAGYHYTATETADTPTLAFRNNDAGATITLVHNADGSKVDTARVDVAAPLDSRERVAWTGLESVSDALVQMEGWGFAPNYTTVGDWLEFVHPDGRGRALRVRDTGSKMEVLQAVGFTPTDRQTTAAREVVFRSDPLAHIRAGDDLDTLRTTLTRGRIWNQVDFGALDNDPDGATSFAKFKRGDGETDTIVVHVRHDGDSNVIVRAGIGVPTQGEGRIFNAAERAAHMQAEKDRRERERAGHDRAQTDTGETIRGAVRAGDKDALSKALGGGTVSDAARLLQQHGFELRGRRRSGGYGPGRRMTYTLRGPNGETIKVAGPNTFSGRVDKVEIIGNPQGGRRDRLPRGQEPKNLNELLVDSLGRADELGQRYGAGVHVTAIVEGGVSSGAAAHHEWNGTIAIRKSGEAKRIRDYLKRRKAGQHLSDAAHLAFYNDLETIQHEINHGVAKPGNEDGGLSFGPRHYRGFGKNIEEALTEETGHLLAVDWLRSHGMTDVLAAVKRNPQDPRVLGVYRDYRVQLKRILDDANVPDADRPALLERMKFQMTPEERQAELLRLSGHDNIRAAIHADPKRRSEMQRNFEPVLRPDLSDIDATPQSVTPEGRTILEGQSVAVDVDGARVQGVVIAIRDDMVKVRTEDGLELWYAVRRVH